MISNQQWREYETYLKSLTKEELEIAKNRKAGDSINGL
jgi:hypothetical protein